MKVRLEKVEGVSWDAEKIIERLKRLAEEKLGSILEKYNATDTVLQAAVGKNRDKTVACKIHLCVPGKKILVAEGKGPDVEVAAKDGIKKIFREAKRHFARLKAQDQYKRKTRREHLRELKARVSELPEPTRREAEKVLSGLLDSLKSVVARELAYLRATGDLPSDYPTVEDVADEAIAATTAVWKPGTSEKRAWEELLRNAFEIIDREVSNSRQYGEAVSIYDRPPMDPEEQAEAMVEEEFYEFYQPDDVLTFSDILPERIEEVGTLPLSEEEEFREAEKASAEAYSWDVLKDLPRGWRRSFILAKVEGMSANSIASVLGVSKKEVKKWIEQSQVFVSARLEEAGIPSEYIEGFKVLAEGKKDDEGEEEKE